MRDIIAALLWRESHVRPDCSGRTDVGCRLRAHSHRRDPETLELTCTTVPQPSLRLLFPAIPISALRGAPKSSPAPTARLGPDRRNAVHRMACCLLPARLSAQYTDTTIYSFSFFRAVRTEPTRAARWSPTHKATSRAPPGRWRLRSGHRLELTPQPGGSAPWTDTLLSASVRKVHRALTAMVRKPA